MAAFSPAFLRSGFAERSLDTLYSRYQTGDADECFRTVLAEIRDQLRMGSEGADVYACDIGYIYRLLNILTSVPSKELCDIIPYEKMVRRAPNFDHYGFEESAEDLIREHSLLCKRL